MPHYMEEIRRLERRLRSLEKSVTGSPGVSSTTTVVGSGFQNPAVEDLDMTSTSADGNYGYKVKWGAGPLIKGTATDDELRIESVASFVVKGPTGDGMVLTNAPDSPISILQTAAFNNGSSGGEVVFGAFGADTLIRGDIVDVEDATGGGLTLRTENAAASATDRAVRAASGVPTAADPDGSIAVSDNDKLYQRRGGEWWEVKWGDPLYAVGGNVAWDNLDGFCGDVANDRVNIHLGGVA